MNQNAPLPPQDAAAPGQAPQPLVNRIAQLYRSGQYKPCFQMAYQAVLKYPSDKRLMVWVGVSGRDIRILSFSPQIKKAIGLCLENPQLEHQHYHRVWFKLLTMDPQNAPMEDLRQCKNREEFQQKFEWKKLQLTLADPFFLNGICNMMMIDPGMERVLTYLRRWMLLESGDAIRTKHLPFLAALGENTFLGEYVFNESPEETARVEALEKDVEEGRADETGICLYAAYRPLHRLKRAAAIAADNANKGLERLFRLQIEEPLAQKALRDTIPAIGEIKNEVSGKVREMYEENPYPRWKYANIPVHRFEDVEGDYLTAGCGTCRPTSQAASMFPNLRFQAIDLSLSSLSYAKHQTQALGLKNISFAHCDILNVPQLGKTFDIIECSGVLHHMADPVAGWKALIQCLNPGGQMLIGLYSARAREHIAAAQAYVREKKYPPTLEGIRAFRADVQGLPDGHPLKQVQLLRDFAATSECRDLVFHVQEKTYTLPELRGILEDLDLEFLHFHMLPHRYLRQYLNRFPDDPKMTNLGNWEKMEQENPRTFLGMYSFLCRRKGDEGIFNKTVSLLQNRLFFPIPNRQAT